jgi:hypothetical protein
MGPGYSVEPYSIENQPLSAALTEAESQRLMPWQNYQSGTDTRSGNFIMRDFTHQRVFIGMNQATGSPMGRASQAGFDAETAEEDQLIWNIDDNLFKVVTQDTATLPAVAAAASGSQAESSVDINTEVEASSPLIALVFYESAEDESTPLPFFSTLPGPTFGGYIAQRVTYISYLSNGIVRILIEATNFSNGSIGARTMHWYILRETALPT